MERIRQQFHEYYQAATQANVAAYHVLRKKIIREAALAAAEEDMDMSEDMDSQVFQEGTPPSRRRKRRRKQEQPFPESGEEADD